MKMEYIFVKPQDEYCSSRDQFCDFLCLNNRIKFRHTDKKASNKVVLLFDAYELEYRLEHVIAEKSQESVFHFIVEISNDSEKGIDILEDFDAIIHAINDKNGNQFSINTIWNDISSYYGRELYPDILNVEKMLRKIIYLFMIKTVGSKWLEISTPERFQTSVKSILEKNNKSITEINGEWLTYTDFISLIYFFTAPYSLKSDTKELFKRLESYVNSENGADRDKKGEEKVLTVEIINKLSDEYEPKNNWERYFSDKLNVKNPKKFTEDWSSLYNIRNKVAHGKPIYKNDYNKARALIKTYSDIFDECISIIDTLEITAEEAKAVEAVAQQVIAKEPMDILGSEDMSSYGNIRGFEGLLEGSNLLRRRLSEIDSALNTSIVGDIPKVLRDALSPALLDLDALSSRINGITSVDSQLKINSDISLDSNRIIGVTEYMQNTHNSLSPVIALSHLTEILQTNRITSALDRPLTIDLPGGYLLNNVDAKIMEMLEENGLQSDMKREINTENIKKET